MILRRLALKRFLGISDGAFEFVPGINVVAGPNESGKSTLRQALRMALYANPATTSQKIKELRTWGTDDAPEIQLEFEVDERRFVLTKDFASRRVLLTGSGKTWESHKTVQESLVGALGLPTEQLFEATAQVAQAELERVQLTSIAKELSRIVGGGGEDVAAAIHRLEQRIREMEKGSRGMAKDPGILRAMDDRVASLQAQYENLTAGAAEAERKQHELADAQRLLEEIRQQLESTRALLDVNRRMLQREQELAIRASQAAMLEERVKKIEETLATLTEVDRKLEAITAEGMPDEHLIRTARTAAERTRVRESEVETLRRELSASPLTLATNSVPWKAVLAAGSIAGLIGIGLLTAASTSPGLLLVTIGVVALGVGLWKLRDTGAAQRVQHSLREDRQARLAALETELTGDREALADCLAPLGVGTIEAAEERVHGYKQLVQQRTNAESVLAAVRAGAPDEDIREQWNRVRLDVFGIEQELRHPDATGRRLTALEFQSLEIEVNRLEHERARLERLEQRLSWELDRLRQESETLAEVEEQLQEAQDALALARRQYAVYTAALEGLHEARKQAERPVRDVVAGTAGEYLRILSGGRYGRLMVEKDSLDVRVWSADAGAWVPPTEPYLSRGTVDLVYLSLRLALVGALAEGKHPPLLLDDPFITFDERRRQAAAHLLRELSRTHQVFLFTYTRYYDDVADRVIELSDRTDAAPAPPPSPTSDVRVTVGPLWEHPHES